MTKPAWLSSVESFAAVSRIHPRLERSRIAVELLEAHALLFGLPLDIKLSLDGVTDDELQPGIDAVTERLLKGDYRLLLSGVSPKEVMTSLVAHVRALDQSLKELQSGLGPVSDPEETWRVRSGTREAFVVPRARPRAPGARGAHKRSMVWHHIIPAKVEGYAVRLFPSETEFGVEFDDMNFGATLFENLQFGEQESGEKLIVTAVNATDMSKIVAENVEKAHRLRCAILAYPELTIDPVRRSTIQRLLRERPWMAVNDDEDFTVTVVVAGSWHEDEGSAGTFNIATVFDGFGEVVARHRKIFPYFDAKAGKVEGIGSGGEITVLVLEDALIAFGICKDFCERSSPNPFADLDVDLCIVISTGSDSTMRGHMDTARDANIRRGAASLVVQQALPARPDGLGFVLSPHEDLAVPVETLLRTEVWVKISGDK